MPPGGSASPGSRKAVVEVSQVAIVLKVKRDRKISAVLIVDRCPWMPGTFSPRLKAKVRSSGLKNGSSPLERTCPMNPRVDSRVVPATVQGLELKIRIAGKLFEPSN
jgi:hypothetical protein